MFSSYIFCTKVFLIFMFYKENWKLFIWYSTKNQNFAFQRCELRPLNEELGMSRISGTEAYFLSEGVRGKWGNCPPLLIIVTNAPSYDLRSYVWLCWFIRHWTAHRRIRANPSANFTPCNLSILALFTDLFELGVQGSFMLWYLC